MTSLVRKAALLSVCGILVAGAAMAGVPSNSTSSKSSNCLCLVGDDGTSAAPSVNGIPASFPPVPVIASLFTVTVRDPANNVVPSSVVTIDFSGCTRLHVASQSSQKFAGLTVTAGPRTVSAISNASGVASFIIEGAADDVTAPPHPSTPQNCAAIFLAGNATPMAFVTITALNRDVTFLGGTNAVNAGDGATVLNDVLFPTVFSADVDCSNTVNAADGAVVLQHVVTGPVGGLSKTCPPDALNPAGLGYAW